MKLSDEQRAKISAAKKGKASPLKGRKCTEEHKAKVSASLKGRKQSDETKAKISSSHKKNPLLNRVGQNHPSFNKGKAVYLYLVHVDAFELSASFPNAVRCSETLRIPYTTLLDRIKNHTVFKINGLSHIVSRNGNLA